MTHRLTFTTTDRTKEGIRPWVTNFRTTTKKNKDVLNGVIEADPIRLASASSDLLDSEMVRTLFVAIRFGTVHYLPALRYVYKPALEAQKQWLGDKKEVMFDPRTKNHAEIIRNLLGDEVYYGDFGYTNWRDAISELIKQKRAENGDEGFICALESLSRNPESFLRGRAEHGKHPSFKDGFNIDSREEFDKKPFEALAHENAVRAVRKLI